MKHLLLASLFAVEAYAKGGSGTGVGLFAFIAILVAAGAIYIFVPWENIFKSRWGKYIIYVVVSPIILAVFIIGLLEKVPKIYSKLKLKYHQFKYKYERWKSKR